MEKASVSGGEKTIFCLGGNDLTTNLFVVRQRFGGRRRGRRGILSGERRCYGIGARGAK